MTKTAETTVVENPTTIPDPAVVMAQGEKSKAAAKGKGKTNTKTPTGKSKAKTKTKTKTPTGKSKAKAPAEKAQAAAEDAEPRKRGRPSTKLQENQMEEQDILDLAKQINELIAQDEGRQASNDWKIGKLLDQIRSNVVDGTWTRVCNDLLSGIAGRPLKKSSLDKKMKLYNALPNNEEKAVALGVARLDKICKLPKVAERHELLEHGCTIKGKVYRVEELKVRDLDAFITAYMAKNHPKTTPPPQRSFVRAIEGLAKQATKLLEKHTETMASREFDPEDVTNITVAAKTLKDFLASLKIRKAKKD